MTARPLLDIRQLITSDSPATMVLHELAGKPAPESILVDLTELLSAYGGIRPDPGNPAQRISFGTSGHRGSSLDGTFNEDHILAVSQAVAEFKMARRFSGPLFIGMDTHALSGPAFESAVEVFAANGLPIRIQQGRGFTPTPVISHAILTHNRERRGGLADGVVVTPSHNPPGDGGFKYNPPSGGPADTETTGIIEKRANEILAGGLRDVRRMPFEKALRAETTFEDDFIVPYVDDLTAVIDLEAVAASGLKIGVDPLGGSSLPFWQPLAERYRLDLEVVNPSLDPTFSFMRVDHDGRIRMDCSSAHAMAGLIDMKERFDISFGNDPDADRHGIVIPAGGLMNPNHYLAVAIRHLFTSRRWPRSAAVGKTLVSSSMIDRVAAGLGRPVVEVPVGFKWFVDGLLDGSLGFGGEESAGASFLRKDGGAWATDKDGIILNLLAAEITAVSGRDPGELYGDLEERYGRSFYRRTDAPATTEQKRALRELSPESVRAEELAGEPVLSTLTSAPGNGAPIGGLKVVAENGWFAARPSGTEDIYKIYAESFLGDDHLARIEGEAKEIVDAAFRAGN